MEFNKNEYYKKQVSMENILYEMLNLLPESYNKEVQDTNYYKLFRALSKELSDATYEMEVVEKNAALQTATGNSLYNNFGVMVDLQRRAGLSDEQYRRMVTAIIKSLLNGPTKQSMIDAFKSFFNFNAKIYELFRDDIPNLNINNYNNTFVFVVELEIPIDLMYDTDNILEDSFFLIKILKPAHTFSFLFNVYVGEENYKRHYSIDKKIYEISENCLSTKTKKEINNEIFNFFKEEFKSNYSHLFTVDYNSLSTEEVEEIEKEIAESLEEFSQFVRGGISNIQYLDGIQQKAKDLYFLYLKSLKENDIFIYPIPQIIISKYDEKIHKYSGKTEFEIFFYDTFDSFDAIVYQLSKEYVGGDENKVTDEIMILFYEKLNYFSIEATFTSMTGYEENIYRQMKEDAYFLQYNNVEEDVFLDVLSDTKYQLKTSDTDVAIEYLKSKSLEDEMLIRLGGRNQVYADCVQRAESFRTDLENMYYLFGPYYGMDSLEMDYYGDEHEGIYGWRHYGYPLQLMTTTSFDEFKIGGAGLIGPIYTLHDSQIDCEISFLPTREEEYSPIEKYGPFTLNQSIVNSEILSAGVFYPDSAFSSAKKEPLLEEKSNFLETFTPLVLNVKKLNNSVLSSGIFYPDSVDIEMVDSDGNIIKETSSYFDSNEYLCPDELRYNLR